MNNYVFSWYLKAVLVHRKLVCLLPVRILYLLIQFTSVPGNWDYFLYILLYICHLETNIKGWAQDISLKVWDSSFLFSLAHNNYTRTQSSIPCLQNHSKSSIFKSQEELSKFESTTWILFTYVETVFKPAHLSLISLSIQLHGVIRK